MTVAETREILHRAAVGGYFGDVGRDYYETDSYSNAESGIIRKWRDQASDLLGKDAPTTAVEWADVLWVLIWPETYASDSSTIYFQQKCARALG